MTNNVVRQRATFPGMPLNYDLVPDGDAGHFPVPFAGLAFIVTASTKAEMLAFIGQLAGPCGHHHATAMFPERREVYVSAFGLACLRAFIERRSSKRGPRSRR